LKKNYSTTFSDIEYTQDLGYPEYNPSDAIWDQTNPDGTPVLWHLNKIEADEAWDITKGSSNITVAIIDQGFDISHPDLVNKITSTVDSRTGNPFGYTTEYHGTFVASCAGAETDGGGQLASVGFNTMLSFYDYNISAADIAYYASFDEGADVISYSWGGLTSATIREKLLVQEVLDNGTVIVRSAGNKQSDSDNNRFPFAYQVDNRIIIVSATDKNDNHTNPTGGTTYANYPQVSVCSPGYSIMGAIRYNSGSVTNPYMIRSGTSYATPIVAGVCALLKSINKNLTPAEIKNIIQTTVDPVADAYLYPGTIGTGRVNAYNAVQAACATTSSSINFTNQTVNTNTTVVSCGDINVQNVTVTNNAKLTLDAVGTTTIAGDFSILLGAQLEVE
jgi:subtilisin family serine protease